MKNRTQALYVGANDGMLHAFNADTGEEHVGLHSARRSRPTCGSWPSESYATKHQYFVDGSPTSMDVWDGSTWRTILVGGLNAGGRGFYALDVTDPGIAEGAVGDLQRHAPCARSSDDRPRLLLRQPDHHQARLRRQVGGAGHLGLQQRRPGRRQGLSVRARCHDRHDRWTRSAPAPVHTTAPSGLGKIAAWADNFYVDNTATYVYGGDLQGNIWKFDLHRHDGQRSMRLGTATDASGNPQPITTRPELGLVNDIYKVVFVGTGRYLGLQDLTDPATQTPQGDWAWQQSLYAFKDHRTQRLRQPAQHLPTSWCSRRSPSCPAGWSGPSSTQRGGLENQQRLVHRLQPGQQVAGRAGERRPAAASRYAADRPPTSRTEAPAASAATAGSTRSTTRPGSYISTRADKVVARKQPGVLTVGTDLPAAERLASWSAQIGVRRTWCQTTSSDQPWRLAQPADLLAGDDPELSSPGWHSHDLKSPASAGLFSCVEAQPATAKARRDAKETQMAQRSNELA